MCCKRYSMYNHLHQYKYHSIINCIIELFFLTIIIYFFIHNTEAFSNNNDRVSCNGQADIDFSNELGPVRDQGQEGLCWNYAANAIMRQKICKAKGNCNDNNFNLSIFDGMSCANKKNNTLKVGNDSGNGGRPEWALSCMLDKGVCLEKDAKIDDYKKLYTNKEMNNKLNQCKNQGQDDCDNISKKDTKIISTKFLNNILDVANANTAHGNSYSEESNVKNFPKEAQCAYNMVVSNQCKSNRYKANNAEKVEVRTYQFKPNKDNTHDILRKLVEKREGSALGVCLERVQLPEIQMMYGEKQARNNSNGNSNEECINGHAVVLGGMKCINGELHYYIHNSWGKNSPFHGWIPAAALTNAVRDATFLMNK